MNKNLLFFLSFYLLISYGCSTSKKGQVDKTVNLDTVEVSPESLIYRASEKRANDLLHTKLEVKFDWEKQYLYGTAELTLKPYFYATPELTLDAKGFELLSVEMVSAKQSVALPYSYDSVQIKIDLQKTFSRDENYTVRIKYIAKPNDLSKGGSAAITSDKGLYFINPEGKEKYKPRQIWTQGETESSSCWFPTIDKPNERCTQEIYITVNDSFKTLSNGLLISSVKNIDGTRTDFWKQDKPHAPYLFMMAVGDFAVIHDKWRKMDVDYYVEKEFESYAKDIFGNTPEMIELYSNLFKYDYPWAKYSQIPVRDYVSGAMENTTATIFFDALQRTKREMIDYDFEDIIAHELFHQWFGDLVTCESWSNLPLNESFATYGEYLWIEHKYGNEAADYHLSDWLKNYLRESQLYQEPIIRFHYEDREDMFDNHSYDKGGLILHMLRNYVGDEAFFKSLNLYLTENAYQSVEVHNLRLAFEKTTGEDMNWFFNQWFLSPGHPVLNIKSKYDEGGKKVVVSIKQEQKEQKVPVFRLPLSIDIYESGNIDRKEIMLEGKENTFEFSVGTKPDLVNVDAKKILLGKKEENKSVQEFVFQYRNAPLYTDRTEAVKFLSEKQSNDSIAKQVIHEALNDSFWAIRKFAVEKISLDKDTVVKELLVKIARNDSKSKVRAAAIKRLDLQEDKNLLSFYKELLADSSFMVASASLEAIYTLDKKEALQLATQFEVYNNSEIISAVGNIYGKEGDSTKQDFFEDKLQLAGGYTQYGLLSDYGTYLKNKDAEIVKKGVPTLKDFAINNESNWIKFAATSALHDIKVELSDKLKKGSTEEDAIAKTQALEAELKETIEAIIAQETDENLLKRYKAFN